MVQSFAGVYFFKSGDFVKIGRSSDIKRRFLSLKTGNPIRIEPIASICSSNCFSGMFGAHLPSIEKSIHSLLEKRRHRGEWFSINWDETLFVLQEYSKNPFCHPILINQDFTVYHDFLSDGDIVNFNGGEPDWDALPSKGYYGLGAVNG